LLLGAGQQLGSFARALFGQQRIEAGNQTFAGKVRKRDLDQIRLRWPAGGHCPDPQPDAWTSHR